MQWKVKAAQSCLTLCNPMDCSLPDSSVQGIQARILEWVAIPFSRGIFPTRDQIHVSHIAGGFFTIWTTKQCRQPLKTEKDKKNSPLELLEGTHLINTLISVQWDPVKHLKLSWWTSLVVQRLTLYAPSAGVMGSVPGWGTKIPHDSWSSLKQKQKVRTVSIKATQCVAIY